MTIIVAILVFGILVTVHEFGHFIIGKLFDTKVREFAIGMGVPVLFKKQVGETKYTIRALPIGGFCDFGEDDVEEESDDPRLLNNKSPWVRMAVVVAGPIFNFILALLIFIIVVSFQGYRDNTVSGLVQNGPAATAGIQQGDRIVSIDGERIHLFKEVFLELMKKQRAEGTITTPMNVVVDRNGQELKFTITPVLNKEQGTYMIGIQSETKDASFLTAIQYGYHEMIYSFDEMVYSLQQLFTGKVSKNEVAGPVGIIQIVGASAKQGWVTVASLTALLSINLGLVNLLPLPALDGSRFLIGLFEGVTGRRVNRKLEITFHTIGFAALMLLMVIVTINDVRKLF